mmetsp:Transcript_20458/g.39168  ORF Transcript_20458/g.39168 Transcript_20458/m.39168 type:complete len:226 (-) Transcript_20458:362-1039(-)
MTLSRHREDHDLPVEALLEYKGACIPLPLLRTDNLSDAQALELKAWMVSQILMLVSKFKLEVLLEAHNMTDKGQLYQSLVDSASRHLKRFSSVVDTCDRVLNAGVACRFEGRLLPAYETVKAMLNEYGNWSPDCAEKQILSHADMTIHDVFWSLNRMVCEGRQLADADLLKRHGPSKDAQNEARLNWVALGLHSLQLDWLCCAMGIASMEELRTLDESNAGKSES